MTLHLSKVFFFYLKKKNTSSSVLITLVEGVMTGVSTILWVNRNWSDCTPLRHQNEQHLDVSKHFLTPLSVDCGEAAAFVMSEHF